MARRPGEKSLTIAMSDQELAFLAVLTQEAAAGSLSNLVREALVSLADELQIAIPDGVLDRRQPGCRPMTGVPRDEAGRWLSTAPAPPE